MSSIDFFSKTAQKYLTNTKINSNICIIEKAFYFFNITRHHTFTFLHVAVSQT